MSVRLIAVPHVRPEWETVHRIRALELNGSSAALVALDVLRRKHPDDYRKLMETVKVVAAHVRVANPRRVRKDAGGDEVYEMKGGHARLFFFYTPDDGVVVCTHHFWKAKPSVREQDAEFRKCARLRALYVDENPGPLAPGRRPR